MSLKNYGIVKGRAIDRKIEKGRNPHYQIRLTDKQFDYRVAINVKSQHKPSELLYLVDEDFHHPIVVKLLDLPLGFTPIQSRPGGLALDFIRGNLFDREQMKALPSNVPGPDNDLNEQIDRYVLHVIDNEEALLYAFGERWGPKVKQDKYFGFVPSNGIHDIHMNQGNVGSFTQQDGVWQDGALLIHFPIVARWVAIFLKFQSQSWHTDDVSGHRIESYA